MGLANLFDFLRIKSDSAIWTVAPKPAPDAAPAKKSEIYCCWAIVSNFIEELGPSERCRADFRRLGYDVSFLLLEQAKAGQLKTYDRIPNCKLPATFDTATQGLGGTFNSALKDTQAMTGFTRLITTDYTLFYPVTAVFAAVKDVCSTANGVHPYTRQLYQTGAVIILANDDRSAQAVINMSGSVRFLREQFTTPEQLHPTLPAATPQQLKP